VLVENSIVPDESLTLAQFIEVADGIYDPYRPESIWEVRNPLVALAQNNEEIWRLLLYALSQRVAMAIPTEQAGYFILYNGKRYSVRATVWLPEGLMPEKNMIENGVFAYDYPHNHNFDLLTTVVMGDGYETEIYEVPMLPKDTVIGTLVDCRYRGRHHLRKGTVFLYNACTDVHIQVPVRSLSVALNFLPRSPLTRERSQYAFDIVSDTQFRISGAPLSTEARELLALRLLAKLYINGFPVKHWMNRIEEARDGSRVGHVARRYLSFGQDSEGMHDFVADELMLGGASSNYHNIARNVRQRRLAAEAA
jgi:hypothetical protein